MGYVSIRVYLVSQHYYWVPMIPYSFQGCLWGLSWVFLVVLGSEVMWFLSSMLLFFFLWGESGQTWWYSGVTRESRLEGTGDHMECRKSNMGWPPARQMQYPLYYHSGSALLWNPNSTASLSVSRGNAWERALVGVFRSKIIIPVYAASI